VFPGNPGVVNVRTDDRYVESTLYIHTGNGALAGHANKSLVFPAWLHFWWRPRAEHSPSSSGRFRHQQVFRAAASIAFRRSACIDRTPRLPPLPVPHHPPASARCLRLGGTLSQHRGPASAPPPTDLHDGKYKRAELMARSGSPPNWHVGSPPTSCICWQQRRLAATGASLAPAGPGPAQTRRVCRTSRRRRPAGMDAGVTGPLPRTRLLGTFLGIGTVLGSGSAAVRSRSQAGQVREPGVGEGDGPVLACCAAPRSPLLSRRGLETAASAAGVVWDCLERYGWNRLECSISAHSSLATVLQLAARLRLAISAHSNSD
jgi:hypothetical protein